MCAGAAVDRAAEATDEPPLPDAFEFPDLAAELARGAFARAFASGRVLADTVDESLLPQELPYEAWLRQRLALAADDSIEACSALGFGLAPPQWKLTPAHLRVGHDHLALAEPAQLQLSDAEAHALADAARPVLAAEGWQLTVAAPLHWFLGGGPPLRVRARAWNMASGHNVDAYLPEGEDARRWRRLLTEIQMIWFDHPVNRERELRHLPTVNMLWLDGRCVTPRREHGGDSARRTAVCTRDAAVAGAAIAAGFDVIDVDPLAFDADRLAANATQDLLVDVPSWRAARRTGDLHGWIEAWRAFDAWCAGLPALMRGRGRADRLDAVFSAERRRVELTTGGPGKWMFWRRLDAVSRVLRG